MIKINYYIMNKENKIIILDIETTGFLNSGGKIVEIGIVELNIKTGEKQILFDKIIKPENYTIEQLEKTWICSNNYMDAKEIFESLTIDYYFNEVQKIIDSYENGVTAFNINFDIDFMRAYGFEFSKLLPCPMKLSTNICKLPNRNGYSNYKWPKAEEAYNYFFPDSNYTELHRGADDAMHEADIVFKLIELGIFKLN